MDYAAIITALAGLAMAVSAIVKAARGKDDHEENVGRLAVLEAKVAALEAAKPRKRNRRVLKTHEALPQGSIE